MRLYVLVEGQTEEEFVRTVLGPHLQAHHVWVQTFIVETSRDALGRKRRGGGRWKHWFRDLQRLTAEQAGPDVRFTTLFDLYGLPEDFPGLEKHSGIHDTTARADVLAGEMAEKVADWRLIPYLQRHEFEALILAGLDVLGGLLDAAQDLNGLMAMKAMVQASAPEDINDGPTTAPSKRLLGNIPSYRKTVHGPLVVHATGLLALRKACPRFDGWVTKLEVLGKATSP
jgi:hypothetical protein